MNGFTNVEGVLRGSGVKLSTQEKVTTSINNDLISHIDADGRVFNRDGSNEFNLGGKTITDVVLAKPKPKTWFVL